MCGILGIVSGNAGASLVARAGGASRTIRHRGPDDEGFLWIDAESGAAVPFAGPDTDPGLPLPALDPAAVKGAGALLGHRRLSILDLSPAGHQPMSAGGGKLWITFNGEIYNYRELRAELEKEGHRFQTQTDTEVILAAYLQWGAAMLTRFTGMFAFCLADQRVPSRTTLLLARDVFGIKPLYYTSRDDEFLFCSEIKGLLALAPGTHHINAERLYTFLQFGNSEGSPATLIEGFAQLPPAHAMEVVFSEGKWSPPRQFCYWECPSAAPEAMKVEEAALQFRTLFLESVGLHLRSDVPLGVALSGGLDSSSIVAAIRHLEPRAEIHTFSFVDKAKGIDEESYMDIVGGATGAIMHKISSRGEELAADLEDLVRTQDLPFATTSVYAQYRVMKLARENGIKVMLDGQGADELLGGYPAFFVAKLRALLHSGNWVRAVRFLQALGRSGSRGATLRSYLVSLLPDRLRAALQAGKSGGGHQRGCMDLRWFASRGVAVHGTRRGKATTLHEALALSLTNSSLPDLLRYEDRNSMRFSIESRVPFLTPAMARFTARIPESFLIPDSAETKLMLRKGMRGIVPDAILDRRDKIGFATPEAVWLRALMPWIQAELMDPGILPMLDHTALQRLREASAAEKASSSWILWRCISLSAWMRQTGVTAR